MPPGLNLPASLLEILSALRPCFTAQSFVTFCGLAAGLAGQTRRRTVTGMLLGACLQRAWPHDCQRAWPHDCADIFVMPTQAGSLWSGGCPLRSGRHNHRDSRKARSASAGWYRPGLAAGGLALSIAFCLMVMSA
jgi:hypothetical protein